MAEITPPTDAEAPAIAQQGIHLLRWLERLVIEGRNFLTEIDQFLAKNDPPRPKPRWRCPGCGSEDIEAEAWVRLNDEAIVDYEENSSHWCPDCQAHFKRICEVDPQGRCLMHDQPFDACRGN